MRLTEVEVVRLRGGTGGFRIDELSPGINLVLGPNGSGKTSLCQALVEILWPGGEATQGSARLVARIDRAGERLEAELDRGVSWRSAGDSMPRPPPPLPPVHLAAAYWVGLRDLLDDDHPTDRDLAERIRVELAGGFDLLALRSARSPRRHGRKEEQALVEAADALAELERQRRELAREDDRRDSLRAELAAAEGAEHRARSLRMARELADQKRRLVDVERRRAALGVQASALEALGGSEAEELAGLDRELAVARAELDDEEAIARDADRRMAECRLPGGPPEPIVINRLRAHVAGIESLEGDRQRVDEDLAAARAAVAECERVLSGDLDTRRIEVLGASEMAPLTGWIEAAREQDARRAHLLASLEPEEAPSPESLETERATLARNAELIREWLAASAGPVRGVQAIALLASGFLVAATGLLLALHPGLWWPAWWSFSSEDLRALSGLLIGAGGGAVAVVCALALRAMIRRRRIRGELSRRGLPELSARSVDPALMQNALRVVETRLAALAHRVEESTLQRATRRQLEALGTRDREIEARRRVLAEALGVDPGLPDLTLGELAMRVSRLSEARLAAAELVGRADWLDGCAKEVGDRLRADLEKLPGESLGDPRRAGAIVDDLCRRTESWRRAADEAGQAVRRIDGLHRRIERLGDLRRELYERAGLRRDLEPDEARKRIEERIALLAPHRELRDAGRLAEERILELEQALGEDLELCSISVPDAEAALERAEAQAAEVSRIASELGAIDARVEAAARSRDLEGATARVAAAKEALAERRDELLVDLVGDFLLDEVEAEFERTSRPAALDSASLLFSRFTGHRYSLDVDTQQRAGGFVAVDSRSGERRAPGQLSDGTRMQLLLAARLGFALSSETETRPPFFFDEALTASDPERFRAVASCLIELAAEGRQIFYVTCDPQDAGFLESICEQAGAPAPRVVDFGALRAEAASHDDTAAYRPPRDTTVPPPDGQDAASYAVRLNVPRPEPFSGAGDLHLFWVLRDDLPLLHRVLTRGRVERIGEWRSLESSGATEPLFGAAEAARVSAAADVAERYVEAWRIGRGRPVDEHALRGCEAVSETFLPRIDGIARDVDGDARAIVAVLEAGGDPRASRFRSDQQARLREYLEAEHYLDLRPRLDAAELRARVLGSMATAPDTDLAAVQGILDGLVRVIEP